MTNPANLQANLKTISAGYAAKLPEKIAEIEQALERLPTERFDEPGMQDLYRMVHSLIGSGQTFGFRRSPPRS
jgi:hypothetical protein